ARPSSPPRGPASCGSTPWTTPASSASSSCTKTAGRLPRPASPAAAPTSASRSSSGAGPPRRSVRWSVHRGRGGAREDGPVSVDCAVYEHGERRPGSLDLDEALAAARGDGAFVWLGLHEPTPEEFEAVSQAFGLHELAVEDALKAHQRPKLEVYDQDLFVVLKTAAYDDDAESVELGELQLFVGADYVVSVRHGRPSALTRVRARVDADLERIRLGPMAVLHAVIDQVVDDYVPVVEGLDNNLVEVEGEVFDTPRPRGADPTPRMYALKREILDFYRNTEPLL